MQHLQHTNQNKEYNLEYKNKIHHLTLCVMLLLKLLFPKLSITNTKYKLT